MRMVIIGAGATAFSRIANPDRRPPLANANDFKRMFKYASLCGSEFHRCARFFLECIGDYDGDIEGLFTDLYLLMNKIDESSERLEKLKSIVGSYTLFSDDYERYKTIFIGILFNEIRLCLGTSSKHPTLPRKMPLCSWHRLIAKQLSKGDVVVNFNYDQVMAYALLNEKKLSSKSFPNSYIKRVDIQPKLVSETPIVLLTPHGSFTWYKDEAPKNYYDEEGLHLSNEFHKILREIDLYNSKNLSVPKGISDKINKRLNGVDIIVGLNIYPPYGSYSIGHIILPFKRKKILFEQMPFYKEEYQLFLDYLKVSDEIYLIGKQFKTSDTDIADDIKDICRNKERELILVNPDSAEEEWRECHCRIFNAKNHEWFKSIESYCKGLMETENLM